MTNPISGIKCVEHFNTAIADEIDNFKNSTNKDVIISIKIIEKFAYIEFKTCPADKVSHKSIILTTYNIGELSKQVFSKMRHDFIINDITDMQLAEVFGVSISELQKCMPLHIPLDDHDFDGILIN